jgi:hypothetical protein
MNVSHIQCIDSEKQNTFPAIMAYVSLHAGFSSNNMKHEATPSELQVSRTIRLHHAKTRKKSVAAASVQL